MALVDNPDPTYPEERLDVISSFAVLHMSIIGGRSEEGVARQGDDAHRENDDS